ncbi:4-alpha-glucanotransferase [Angustibacter speluncae]
MDDDTAQRTPRLDELAARYGVATEYWDWQGAHVLVPESTVVAVLGALGVDASSAEQVERALADADEEPWRRTLPPVVVVRSGETAVVPVHVTDGDPADLEIVLEDGTHRETGQVDKWVPPRTVDGVALGEATFRVPADLPLGWHELVATTPSGRTTCPLVVTPRQMELPEQVWDQQRWGFMTQLYSVRSRASWGVGDLADLSELAAWSGAELGADFLLVNPLHAAEPVGRMEPSPYLPTTRRFVNPLYIRVEDVRETAYLPSTARALIEWQAEELRAASASGAGIDRDAAWTAKREALATVYAAPRSPAREAGFRRFCEQEGEGLTGFATWNALAEHLGLPASQWPADVRDPASEEVARLSRRLADRIEFHKWLQWVADEQLAGAQRTALEAGMAFGVVVDLAVGVHPDGADTWALGPALARGVSVGAPPDAFNQQGQDWSQPPWRPDTLAASGYAAYRDMLRTVLRHAGGVRVDHVMGLFRLWWIPEGAPPDQGTYVRFDHEALLGILCLEAHRAGAFVVGEDLGVVEPWVREVLADRGVLGTSILWFEKDEDGEPLEPEQWRELCLATVTTHDLPPTAGYLAGEHVDLRARLGLLTREVDEERRIDEAERAQVLDLLRRRSLLPDDPTERQVVEALHKLLTWAPSRLLGVQLADAVGDRRPQNQPGTNTEYPNWQMPLADGSGLPVLLEDLLTRPRALSLAEAVSRRA